MIYQSLKFDDVVKDEHGIWSQICIHCQKKYFSKHKKHETPVSNLTCGIEQCSNEADFYIDFICETTGQEKN
jgi:hypothetical protein